MDEKIYECELNVRISLSDAHYAGNLIDGAHIMKLFGDVATQLTIQTDGDEGLLRAYDYVEFLSPVYAGVCWGLLQPGLENPFPGTSRE